MAGTDTISAIIAGANGLNYSSTTTGTLLLSGANTFSGTINISSGTLAAFSDANLGAAANGITFNGSTAAGLTLNAPSVLNASRTITLSNTGGAVALLTSTGAAAQVVLGQVTGTGTFAIANAGTTYLLNSTNNNSGILWAQSGIVSLNVLSDASGNGNVKLGSAAFTGGIQWGNQVTAPLVLTNRSIELAGTTGGGTIDSSSLTAANSITINNLIFTTVSSGAKTLTLTGVNGGTNTFAANVTDNGTSTTALTKSGLDQWVLTGSANTYSGILTINQGTLKVVNASGLGGSGSLFLGAVSSAGAGQGLDIRSDVAPTGVRSISNNTSTNAFIFVDHAATPGNSTTGQVLTLGTVAQANSSAGITFVGDHGYGVVMGLNTLASSNATTATVSTYTITNDLGSPGLTGYTVGANEFISIAGFAESGANTGGVSQTLNGWGNYTINGPISNSGSLKVDIVKSGLGVLTFSPTTLSGWNTGTLSLSAGTTRVTSAMATGGSTVTMSGGLLELRNDASTNFGFNVAGVTAASTLVLDHSIGGTTSGQTATIGNLSTGANTSTLNVVGDHGYSLTMGTVTVAGTKTLTLANYLGAPGYLGYNGTGAVSGYNGGTITLGNITTDATAGTSTLALAGYGNYSLNGTISSASAGTAMSITQSSLGVVTFAGANSGWTSTTQGTLTASGGTTLIDATNTNAVGSANLSGTAGLLEILSATGTSGAPWTTKNLTLGGAYTLVADPLAGSSATGQTVNLGALNGAAQTLTINSDHGYGITFNAAGTEAASSVLTNVGNGTVTLAGGFGTTTAATWTLNGPGDFNVSGAVTSVTATAFTKSGYGMVTLGNSNTINGTISVTSGILRLTNAGALAGSGAFSMTGGNNNSLGAIGLDLRSDTSMDLSSRPFSASSYDFVANVDRAVVGGTGTNNTISLGGGPIAGSSGWGFTAIGAHGYSLQFSTTAFQEITNIGYTINNFIPSSSTSTSTTAGIIFNSGITFNSIATASTLTFAGTGDYLVSGNVTNTGATAVVTIAKSGTGTLTIANDNSASWNVASDSVLTATAGIVRLTNGNGLGGANATFNLNAATLDLRSDAGITQAGPVVTVGATSNINVDRAIGSTATTGGTQTITSLKDNGAFAVYTTGGANSGGNAYNLAISTFTMGGINTAAIPTIVNSIGNGGALNIATFAGAAGDNVFINGPGTTNITSAFTANTGTLTKSGTGTLTLSGPAGYAATNTNGAITVNGGTLALNFTGITTPSNLLQSGAALTLGAASAGGVSGGTLKITAAGSGATAQTLGAVTLQAGQDNITLVAGGTSNTLTVGTLTATNAGSTMLITSPSTTSFVANQVLNTSGSQGRNVVFFDGTSYNWAQNTGVNTTTTGITTYTALPVTAGTSTTNYIINSASSNLTLTATGSLTPNSLKIDTAGGAGALHLGAFNITLTQGGILFVGSNAFTIDSTNTANGVKSAITVASDTVINNYGTGTLTISAPILTGTGTTTATFGGTGTTIVGNSTLHEVGTYAGITYLNGGTLQLATGAALTQISSSINNTLTINGGTLDLNGNSPGVGTLNGGPAAVIDNTSSSAATLTIGNNNANSVFNGTIQNTGSGLLTIAKVGTGTLLLGDAVTGRLNNFKGNLTDNNTGVVTFNSMADTSGSTISLGAAGLATATSITFAGNSNLVLGSRAIDLVGAGATTTITSSSVIGASNNGVASVIVINSALGTAGVPSGSGALTLVLTGSNGNVANGWGGNSSGQGVSGISGTGSVAEVNAFNGAIKDPASGTLALTISSTGGWQLGGNNGYSGGTTISSTGLVRAISGTAFGTNTVNVTGTSILDLRSDTGLTFANAFTMNASFTINVDRAIGGSGYGQIMNIGALTEATTAKTLTVANLSGTASTTGSSDNVVGYGLHIAGLNLNAGTATTIQNSLGSPGSAEFVIPTAGTGVAGALVIDGVTAAASLGTHTLTFGSVASNNFGVTVINGDIVQGAGTTLGLTVAGGGGNAQFITLAGQTSVTNYSGGLILGPGTGLATVRATNQYSLGTGTVTFNTANASTLEIRNDSSVTYSNQITIGNTTAATDKLNVGEALNGSSGRNNTFTFGQLNFQGVTGNILTVAGIGGSTDTSGNAVTFGGVLLGNNSLNGAATFTVTNSLLLPGILNLGNVTSSNTTSTTTQTLTIAGAGVTTLGNVTDSNTANGSLTAITYSGTGILDLSRVTSANTYTGGLTVSGAGGIARVTNQFGLGANTGTQATSNVVNLAGGMLELLSDTNVSYSNQMLLNGTGNGTLNVGELHGGTSVNGATGVLFTLGQLKIGTTGKVFAVGGIGSGQSSATAVTMASSADSVTLSGGVDLNGLAATTIQNNLPLPGMLNLGNVTSSAVGGTPVLTISGAGVTTVGDVTNGSAASVALTYTGSGILDLSRMTAATNYSGGFTLNGTGITRVTNPLQLGTASGVSLSGGTLEIRSDSNFTYANPLNWNGNTGNVNISIGEVGTGTTTGVGSTFSFGALTVTTATAKTLSFGGIGNSGASSSDSVTVSGVTVGAGNLSNTIANNLALPGTLSLGAITGAASTTAVLTIGGNGFTSITDITNGAGGGTAGLTYGGTGILQVNGTGASNFSGGLNLTGAGILRMMGANSFGSATSQAITLSAGTFDVRTDTNLSIANPVTISGSMTINVDAATPGNLSKTVTFSGAASTVSVSGKTLTLSNGGNYGLTFTNGFADNITGAAQTFGITNNASGIVNLGAISFANALTSNGLTLGGSGYTVVGNLSGNAASNTLAYTGTGFLDLTGNNNSTVSTQITAVTLSGAGGIMKVNSTTNLGAANDVISFTSTVNNTLQVRNDGAGSNSSIPFGNGVALNINAALATIDVGNSTANTGNTIAFGALTNSGAQTAGTLTVNGANGYGVSFTSFALPNGTGATTTLIANAPVTISGTVTQAITPVAAHFDTLVLDGVSGGTIGGAISDSSTGGVTVGNGDTRITKNGAGTWTLGGLNTYVGPTVVNAGALLINGSTSATSTVTVNGSAAIGTQGTLGGTGTVGSSVTLATATSFNLGPAINPGAIGTIGTLTINGALTTNNFSKLNFDITSAGNGDLISTAILPVLGASTQLNFNTLGTLTIGNTYTLINGYSGTIASVAANLVFGGFTGVDTTHTGVLVNNSGSLQLLIGGATPSVAYWSGAVDGNWNTLSVSTAASNWRTDATSNTDTNAAPGATTDVHFVTSSPTAANLTTTLGQNFTIKTLSFDSTSTSAVTINSGSTLTITPSSSSTGITLDAAAGAVTINSAVTLGAAQTWTNNSTTNQLTVTGNVVNGGNSLTLAGPVGGSGAGAPRSPASFRVRVALL